MNTAVTANTAPSFKLEGRVRLFSFLALALLAVIAIVAPEQAMAASAALQDKADEAYSWLELAVGFILTVAVLGSGTMAAFGRMEWKTVGQVLVGCIVAGLAVAVVDALYW